MFPAAEIAWFLALVLSWLAISAASYRMRFVFLAAVILLYALPPLFPSLIPPLVLLVARIVLGIFGYLYLKASAFRFGP